MTEQLEQGEGEKSFIETLSKFKKSDVGHFFDLLVQVISNLSITENDKRCSFITTKGKDRLAFIIGSRYCLSIIRKVNWIFISPIELIDEHVKKVGPFQGGNNLIYTSSCDYVVENINGVVQASKAELNRTSTSAFLRFNDQVFIKAVFNEQYRSAIFSKVNFQDESVITFNSSPKVELVKYPLNQILYGPPGTGKTYTTKTIVYAIGEGITLEEAAEKDRSEVKVYCDHLQDAESLVYTTFHQSISYEDFIEGIKPTMIDGKIGYHIEDGILKKLAKSAKSKLEYPYFLVIDEINRGNVSAIFGELITLIEEDKRIGADEQISITLPYSKEEFSLPSNLYVIGTMNTADRSVEALDTALRRRFSFIEMMPQLDKLSKNVDGVNLQELLRVINDRLTVLKDSDHTIGHAFFINCEDLESIKLVFADKIIPLLQEFFYGEIHKVELVLGKAFIKQDQNIVAIHGNSLKNLKAKPAFISRNELLQLNFNAFTGIYEQ